MSVVAVGRSRIANVGVMAAVVAALLAAGCAGANAPDLALNGAPSETGSLAAGEATKPKAVSLPALAKAHADKPDDRAAAVAYAKALRTAGKPRESLAILDRLPDAASKPLLVDRGLLALEAGETAKARELLLKAATEKDKDWRVLSALGVAEASSGNQAKAQSYFKQALQASPNNPVVQNNLALSYLLEKKAAEGAALLKTAAAKPGSAGTRVGRNLALASTLTSDSEAVAQ